MPATHQLLPKLKSLKLSGILATLEVRNQQAIQEKCTYMEFLERLLEDEVERRGQKQLELRLRRSSLDPTKTLEAFDFSFNPSIHRQQIFDLATCSFVERAEAVWILGPSGVGKSHLAHALGHEAVRRGYDVACVRTSAMLAHLNGVARTARTRGDSLATCVPTSSSSMTSDSSRCGRLRPKISTK